VTHGRLKLYTIAPDHSFIDVLADHVLNGFPGGPGPVPADRLYTCRVMLPTRRAARLFQQALFAKTKREAVLMPRITAIGDIDEDQADFPYEAIELPPAASENARLFTLMVIIGEWAEENPHVRLAAEVRADPRHRHSLALSLMQLMDSIEIEDFDAARIRDAYTLDIASHREVILGLIDLASRELPRRLSAEGLISAHERRNRLLRLEARRLADARSAGPIIAAGSTGSIPATRDLLLAIARNENGAVVLPGVDMMIDSESWNAISPQHPQYALKQFLVHCQTDRTGIIDLTPGSSNRVWLAGETMRPSAISENWLQALEGNGKRVAEGAAGLRILACGNLEEEAEAIAFVMRECLEEEGKTAALVTPDRILARMVKASLTRWNVEIDDSAGEPLAATQAASLLLLLCDAALSGISPPDLARIIHHPLARFGVDEGQAVRRAALFDLAAMRRKPSPTRFEGCLALARQRPAEERLHPVLQRFSDDDRAICARFADDLEVQLRPLTNISSGPAVAHIEVLEAVLRAIAGEALDTRIESRWLHEALAAVKIEAHRIGTCSFAETAQILHHVLQRTPFRSPEQTGHRLSILGLLEARLIRPDIIILGGLNEGVWPSQPDAGPWLNRPMRDVLGLQQPERQIGQMAHDFVQALGCPAVYLAFARRIGGATAQPSRWLLRLGMICDWAKTAIHDERIPQLVAAADEPERVAPVSMPRPTPALALRPQRLSVTSIQKLIEDAYAVYAREILKLFPLDDHEDGEDLALRGVLFHDILNAFAQRFPVDLPADALQQLLSIAEEKFSLLDAIPEARRFWLPRFRRIAEWFIALERDSLRPMLRRSHAEVWGKRVLTGVDPPFELTARADRIDVLKDGSARIVDFKTGTVPSWEKVKAGLYPQLTLEAAIHEAGGFALEANGRASEIAYVKLSGRDEPVRYMTPPYMPDIAQIVQDHLAGLERLIRAFGNIETPYIPRGRNDDAEKSLDYDHLSRFREWAWSGDGG
jgi:ATP-dependent helicase/nuclease subunit B